jgi:hypothetical protein
MLVEIPIRQRAVRSPKRMDSPLENRKVRLRGLGGPAIYAVRSTCASATRRSPGPHRSVIPSERGIDNLLRLRAARRINKDDFERVWSPVRTDARNLPPLARNPSPGYAREHTVTDRSRRPA